MHLHDFHFLLSLLSNIKITPVDIEGAKGPCKLERASFVQATRVSLYIYHLDLIIAPKWVLQIHSKLATRFTKDRWV